MTEQKVGLRERELVRLWGVSTNISRWNAKTSNRAADQVSLELHARFWDNCNACEQDDFASVYCNYVKCRPDVFKQDRSPTAEGFVYVVPPLRLLSFFCFIFVPYRKCKTRSSFPCLQ